MPRYLMKGIVVLSTTEEIEANSPEEAERLLFEKEADGEFDPRLDWDRVGDSWKVIEVLDKEKPK